MCVLCGDLITQFAVVLSKKFSTIGYDNIRYFIKKKRLFERK